LHLLKLLGTHIGDGQHSTSSHAFIELNEGYTKNTLVHMHTQTHTQACICTHTLSLVHLKLLWW